MFVCLEGIDGAGKSTQSRLLVQGLQAAGHSAELVYDPGTTELGKAIRELILERNDPITATAQMLLFSSARAELSAHIRLCLQREQIVVCDRWILSTLVYQATGNQLDPELIMHIFKATSVTPDLCIVLDLLPEAAEARRAPSKDRYESRPLAEKVKMRLAYLDYATNRPECAKTTHVLNADAPQEHIQSTVFKLVMDQLALTAGKLQYAENTSA